MNPIVGVLALQGSSEPHCVAVERLGETPREVRQAGELAGLTHLILPGGESTTIHHLLQLFGLWEPIRSAYQAGQLALFGTCAGAILLGQEEGLRPPRMQLLDAVASRNAYGRQVDSFSEPIVIDGLEGGAFHAVFIRAPRFHRVGPGCRVLARRGDEAVLLEGPRILAAAFHPELTDDLRLHRYFVERSFAASTAADAASFSCQS